MLLLNTNVKCTYYVIVGYSHSLVLKDCIKVSLSGFLCVIGVIGVTHADYISVALCPLFLRVFTTHQHPEICPVDSAS